MWHSFVTVFQTGGWVLYPIFAVSVLAWYIGFSRLGLQMRITHARERRLLGINTVGRITRSGIATWDNLETAFAESSNPLARFRGANEALGDIRRELDKGNSTMGTLVVIAPLLGLLGTIGGMNEMFSVIADYGFGNPAIMAGGISIALQATLTGLGAAVAILLFQNLLVSRAERIAHSIRSDLKAYTDIPSGSVEIPQGAEMRHRHRLIGPENEKPEINLAPFVDTIMILLIFFVVTANLYVETGVDVSKPKAQSAHSLGQKSVLIGVTREGTAHVFGREISLERLNALIRAEVNKQPDIAIVIVADRDAAVGKAVQVMDQCLLAGAQKISLAAGQE